MAKYMIFVLLLFSTYFELLISVNYTPIRTQIPYPEVLSDATRPTTNGSQHDLLDTYLRETLIQAQNAHKLILDTNTSSFDNLAKTAWTDCIDLYEDSIYQLNQAIVSNDHDQFDVQTLLSAAIANEQTCGDGFLDFRLPSLSSQFPSLELVNSNLSMLITNALVTSKAISSSSYSSSPSPSPAKRNINRHSLVHDIPQWVASSDRELLRVLAPLPDLVVAKDGSGNYTTISQGLDAASNLTSGDKRFVIYVKKGIYKEYVEVKKSLKNIMLIGDGIDATIVTGSKNVQDGVSTFRSATFSANGDGFIARGITFENTAGAAKHQAVALLSTSDRSVFYKCSFKGYQDTLYVHSKRQFYRNCDIYGTVDFIFGDAAVVFQKCNIFLRQPLQEQKNTITAQGKKNPHANTGIVIHKSRITAAAGETPGKSYLGRPWKLYSTTVFMKCLIDGVIEPEGWLEWDKDFALKTLYYGEFKNTGRGAGTRGRVTWPGFHVMTYGEAEKYTVGQFLGGASWLPNTGVPFISGLGFFDLLLP